MKAVVAHGPRDLRIDERPDPSPGPGEVLLAMEWGGVCGSDIGYWKHGASGTAALRHPLVLGHEVAGRVAALGEGVTGLEEGQPVTVHPADPVAEGALPERLAGRTNLCPDSAYFGSAAFDPHTDGGFSEYRAVRAAQIRPLPDGVDTRQGALAEPLGVALHAVRRAPAVRGRTVLVNGAGPIGALVVAAARRAGAAEVIAADISAGALAVARALGADRTVDVGTGEALPQDVEVVFEATGVPAVLGPVLAATARGGTLIQVGNLPGTPAPSALGALVTREITWTGSYRFTNEIDDALRALAEGLDLTPLITAGYPLEEADKALAHAADPATSGKVMLRLDSSTSQ
ncbi:L-idonate 5-dehydrogenase [Streptomyces sp. ODS28]|uniref:L-idonate 5-dehydrogenase n=1 Tax=Streptomyces sp. ODS28 TaxID=3136688 RepID=UPI0031EB0D38